MNHHSRNLDEVRNTSRYFVEHPQVSWALLTGMLLWGVFGYMNMPQRKDPEVPVRETLAIIRWPGMPAERVEQLVTKKVEEQLGQNPHITELRSVTKQGFAYVFAKFDESVDETGRELDDLQQKLQGLQLPAGVAPVELVKEFGDTATLMLTVASPAVSELELDLRARDIQAGWQRGRTAFLWPHARDLDGEALARILQTLAASLEQQGLIREAAPLSGSGFTGFTAITEEPVEGLRQAVRRASAESLRVPELHPDIWQPVVVNDVAQVRAALAGVAGARYTYRELDRFSEKIEKAVKSLETVSRVARSGVLPEQIQLHYSQERWGTLQLPIDRLRQVIGSRSVVSAPASVDTRGRAVAVVPESDLQTAGQIRDILLPNPDGSSSRLRDLFQVERGYESPAPFLNYFHYRDEKGEWKRARAITLDIQMRNGQQIEQFDRIVSAEIEKVKATLPGDLILDRTSDQPEQVRESVDLFMSSLWEAVALVVLVSWLGFWEWRSSLIMALAIPITLAMTFGMAHLLGVDLQQVSIASLIIALGLLVDDPVVAGDAIKRELGAGRPRWFASWQGPTKLARAILFATITNIVAYLPYLLLEGDNRRFLITLPIVMTCALVASRVVSMTFIPLLGYYLLREKSEPSLEERRASGFGAWYYRIGLWSIQHRWAVLGVFTVLLAGTGMLAAGLKQQFFPYERQYLSFVEVWLPENASISSTNAVAKQAEEVIMRVAAEYGRENHHEHQSGGAAQAPDARTSVLRSVTTWVGGGGPRYWLSSNPEPRHPNYAHILLQVRNNFDTESLIPRWQRALDAEIPGATLDVRRLETSAPVGVPVQIRVSGDDLPALREQAAKLNAVLRSIPHAARIRDDWGEDQLTAGIHIDEARAATAGVTWQDIGNASAGVLEGLPLGSVRDGDREIPVTLRLRMDERARAADLRNLYVYSSTGANRVPLSQVAEVDYHLAPARISRYQQARTITVQAFAADGYLPSEVLDAAMPRIQAIEAALPPGFKLEVAGEYKEQVKGFKQLSVVMLVSVISIYFALVIQFKHAIKPLIVFAAIPFGIVGGLLGLLVMGAPFGFMAFLGVASLVGVIVSHIIVLFDFIEERYEEGEPLEHALLDAGILRLRPVLITVGATVIALVPLAMRGGPLWEPLCYVQIGGLTLSTLVTLLLVPVVYAIFVRDLKLVKWSNGSGHEKPAVTVEGPAAVHHQQA